MICKMPAERNNYLTLRGVQTDIKRYGVEVLNPDSQLVALIGSMILPLTNFVKSKGELVFWDYDEPYGFDQFDNSGNERFGLELKCGELFVNRISLFNDVGYNPDSFALTIVGNTNMKNELWGCFGVELQVVYLKRDGKMVFDSIVNLEQNDHRFGTVLEHETSDKSKILALSIADRSLRLFANKMCLLN